MIYRFQYTDEISKQTILDDNKDKSLTEIQTLFLGNFLIFSDIELNLEETKVAKISEMSDLCEYNIINNFHSSCLGEDRQFDCDRDAQLYMLGLVAKATLLANNATMTDMNLEWKFSSQPICYSFSVEQVLVLGGDLYTHLSACKKQYENLRIYINSLTDISVINMVVWDTVIPTV